MNLATRTGSCFITYCVCRSVQKLNIAITWVFWLELYLLSNLIPQTLINEVFAETYPPKTYLAEQFQQKMKRNIINDCNYSRRLLNTHACLTYGLHLWNTTIKTITVSRRSYHRCRGFLSTLLNLLRMASAHFKLRMEVCLAQAWSPGLTNCLIFLFYRMFIKVSKKVHNWDQILLKTWLFTVCYWFFNF